MPATGHSPIESTRYSPSWASLDPEYMRDSSTGLLLPPDINPARLNSYARANATIVSLVRNRELEGMKRSMQSFEARINRKLGYPWIFLNDEEFTEEFKREIRKMTRSEVSFGVVPKEHWSYPDWIDQEKAARERKKMAEEGIIYADSESYRHMCRFQSGFFFKHPLMMQYKYYWRVEPDVDFWCDVDYDPFLLMQANNKKYGFTISFVEYKRTIETLWSTVQDFLRQHKEYIVKDNSLKFIMDDDNKGIDGEYNLCHFWTNFEIADADFWRSKPYQDFFEHLDKSGGFFYERWGDAPVHSIAASLFLPNSAIHFFDDISYRHTAYNHCPVNKQMYHDNGRCNCDPDKTVENDWVSCQKQWFRVGPRPFGG
ncbi:glycosyltransferase family 15 protein [Atractiella rhizophila]|nr:glycosyltransferase family 15 protein [Atractiella rhizophila]